MEEQRRQMEAQNAADVEAAATRAEQPWTSSSQFRPDCAGDRAKSLRCIETLGKDNCEEFFEVYKKCMRGLRDAKAKAREDKGFFY